MATHKIKALCARCGGHYYKEQPTAAVLSGAVAPPPDFMRAARTVPAEPQRLSILTQPALPTESTLEVLNAADTVPSPAFSTLAESLIAFRDGLTKKWRQ